VYPDLNKIEQPVLSDSDEGFEERRLLQSTIEHVRALKGFLAEHGRVRGEHDQLKRQMTDSLGDVEMLRNLVQQLKVQQDQFSSALSTLTSEMEAAARKAQRVVDPLMPRAPDLADFIAKVRATQAETLAAPRALDLAEPSIPAQAAE